MRTKLATMTAATRRLLPVPGSLALTLIAAAGLAVLIVALSM